MRAPALFLAGLVALSAAAEPPKSLSVEAMVLRFKPTTKEQVLQDFALPDSPAKSVETLRAIGRSVDILYRGVRKIALEPGASAKFDGTETRPVIFLGKGGTAPPATVYGLVMEMKVRSATNDSFTLGWEGSLTWSPDLLDRRSSWQDSLQFIGGAANVAEAASQAAGPAGGTVKQAADIGLAVADLFRGGGDANIYELPVLKTVGLSGSRVCKTGQMITTTTAAEAGVKEPQILFFLILPKVEP
jgi:hypothetical protein